MKISKFQNLKEYFNTSQTCLQNYFIQCGIEGVIKFVGMLDTLETNQPRRILYTKYK